VNPVPAAPAEATLDEDPLDIGRHIANEVEVTGDIGAMREELDGCAADEDWLLARLEE
jgi:hypothetical protein